MTAVPIDSDPEGDLGRLAASVEQSPQRVTLTRDGEPVAVVMSALELQGLEDTLELLQSPEAQAALDESIADARAGRLYDSDTVLADLRRRAAQVGHPGTTSP